jgi:group I intron endonuclease
LDKTHTLESLKAISKPGLLNPMFNKTYSLKTINKISLSSNKQNIELYNKDNELIKIYINQVVFAEELNTTKYSISRHIKSDKFFLNTYYIRNIIN